MKRFSERNPVLIGIIGSALLVIVLLASLSYQSLPFFGGGRSYTAIFTEAGGLESGDEVQLAGLTIGSVSAVKLDHGHVAVDFTVDDDAAHLGSHTSAAITTLTVLGKRGVKLDSAGTGTLADGATIPVTRTTPPYDLNDALTGLTDTSSEIDTATVAKALRTLTGTFKHTPAAVRATVRSVSRISTTIASRDREVATLLHASNNVSAILARRNAEITTLLGDGSQLLSVVNARRQAVTSLLVSATKLAQQLDGLVDDNKAALRPALDDLNHVVALLIRNKHNIDTILDRAGPFAGSLGESVSSGPFFQAYVQNLTRPVDLTGLDTSPLKKLLDSLPSLPSPPKLPGAK